MNEMSTITLLGLNALIILIHGMYNASMPNVFLISRDLANMGFLLTIPSWLLLSIHEDPYYGFNILLTLLASTISYFMTESSSSYDMWILYSLAILGFNGLLISQDLLTMYLFLELQSICLYILVTLPSTSTLTTEAGIKYMMTSSLASIIFLFGSLCLYAAIGQTNLEMITTNPHLTPLFIVGFSLLNIALLIKLGAVPFHAWIPDVYSGTSTPMTAFLSTIPKLIMLILITSFMITLLPQWQSFFLTLAILSTILGAWAGLNQTSIKSLLAYSTINHSGLMLFSLSLLNIQTLKATFVYLYIYLINSIQTFSTLLSIQNKSTTQSFPYVGQYLSLSFTHPLMALCLIIGFLSLAGIPPLAGFWAKWTVYLASIYQTNVILILVVILVAALAAYYYLSLLSLAYFQLPTFYPTTLINIINGMSTPKWPISLILTYSTLFLVLFMTEPSLLHLIVTKMIMTTC